MATKEQLYSALQKADAAGDTEAARAIAKRLASGEMPAQTKSGGFTDFANRGIASTFGFPVDLASAGLRAVGVDVPEAPFGGSESIARGMQNIGIGVAEQGQDPQSFTERAGRITGEAASFLIPLGGGLSVIAKSGGKFAQPAQQALTAVAKAPKTAAALEAAGIAGAAAGGHMAQQSGSGQIGQTVGEIIGGIAAPVVATGGLLRPIVQGAAAKARQYGFLTDPQGTGLAQVPGGVRAGNRIQSLVDDPQEAISSLREETIAPLTPAQKIGTPEIMGLERAVAEKSPDMRAALQARDEASMATLRGELTPEGDIGAVRRALEERTGGIVTGLQKRADEALAQAEKRVAALSPQARKSEASQIMRDELERSYSKAKEIENMAWRSLPDAEVRTDGVINAYRQVVADLPRAQADDIPEVAKTMLGKGRLRQVESMKELQGLRSKLLEESRLARAAGNYNKARISDVLADSVLDTLGARAGADTTEAGQALQVALAASREVKETFGRGVIGRILGTDRTGLERVAPELTAQTVLGAGGERGAVGLRELLKASNTPATRQAVQDSLLDSLQSTAVRDGRLNTQAAERWIAQNADVLDEFPDLKANIGDAIKSQTVAVGRSERAKEIGTRLTQAKKSVAAQLLNAPVSKEIDRIIASADPAKTAREIGKMVRQSPEAVEGLRAGAMEYLLRKSGSGQVSEAGIEALSGNKLMKAIMDTRTRQAMGEILGKDGVSRVEKIARELQRIEAAQKAKALGRISDTSVNTLLESMVTTMGARAGARLGAGTSGASLKTASMMSKNAKQLLGRLTNDKAEALLIQAVQDEKLMAALLENIATTRGQREAAKKFNVWMLSTGKQFLEDEE